MKLYRYLFPIITFCGLVSTPLFAIDEDLDDALDERDVEAVQEFLKEQESKVSVEIAHDKLEIAGNVNLNWQRRSEKINDGRVRGSGSGINTLKPSVAPPGYARLGSNTYEVEFNMIFDYSSDCTWAYTQLQFSNDAGTADCCELTATENADSKTIAANKCNSGNSDGINLKKAYFGAALIDNSCDYFEIEIGRRNLYNVFDSRIQFDSRFDGIYANYERNNLFGYDTTYYAKGGVLIEDFVVGHYAWVVEAGVKNIYNCGFDAKASYIDWEFNGVDRSGSTDPESRCHRMYESKNIQLTAIYKNVCMCQKVKAYGAYLLNTAARKREQTNFKRANQGFYAGIAVGEAKDQGDWAVDLIYQYVEAQAVLDCDVSGIGRGNALKQCFVDGIDAATSRGKANYKGFGLDVTTVLSEDITANLSLVFTKEADASIGGTHDFFKTKVELVYAW